MKISYAITVCNEHKEVEKLITLLLNSKRVEDDIVVLVDLTKTKPNSDLLGYLHELSISDHITLVEDKFNNHFADWKNKLAKSCNGDYIFQIDADEYPHGHLLKALPSILEANPVDLIRVPRVNTVQGLTAYHVEKWGWNVNKNNWVNWPDLQWRIYKNDSKIRWQGKVHETITGHTTFAELPAEEAYALYHPKDIKRQEKQNAFYENCTTPRVFIYAPPYDEKSGGATVVHKLCHLLCEKGIESYLYPMFTNAPKICRQDWKAEFNLNFNANDVIIYPEGIVGNPLNATKVVRWILNNPKIQERQYGTHDKLVYHNRVFYNYDFDVASGKIIKVKDGSPENYLHVVESRVNEFKDVNAERVGTCYTLRKGAEKGLKPTHNLEDSIQLIHGHSFKDIHSIFNTTKRFYCYDNASHLSTLAALCGCISIVMPEDGMSKEEWRRLNPGLKYGVAYGEDDIDFAKETSGTFLREYFENLDRETDTQLNTFIEDIINGNWSI